MITIQIHEDDLGMLTSHFAMEGKKAVDTRNIPEALVVAYFLDFFVKYDKRELNNGEQLALSMRFRKRIDDFYRRTL